MADVIAIGNRANSILDSEEWKEAWNAYRTRIFEEIEAAQSNDTEKVMHLKRLLSAGNAAQKHLERLVMDGKVAAKNLELDEQQRKRFRLFG